MKQVDICCFLPKVFVWVGLVWVFLTKEQKRMMSGFIRMFCLFLEVDQQTTMT